MGNREYGWFKMRLKALSITRFMVEKAVCATENNRFLLVRSPFRRFQQPLPSMGGFRTIKTTTTNNKNYKTRLYSLKPSRSCSFVRPIDLAA